MAVYCLVARFRVVIVDNGTRVLRQYRDSDVCVGYRGNCVVHRCMAHHVDSVNISNVGRLCWDSATLSALWRSSRSRRIPPTRRVHMFLWLRQAPVSTGMRCRDFAYRRLMHSTIGQLNSSDVPGRWQPNTGESGSSFNMPRLVTESEPNPAAVDKGGVR